MYWKYKATPSVPVCFPPWKLNFVQRWRNKGGSEHSDDERKINKWVSVFSHIQLQEVFRDKDTSSLKTTKTNLLPLRGKEYLEGMFYSLNQEMSSQGTVEEEKIKKNYWPLLIPISHCLVRSFSSIFLLSF